MRKSLYLIIIALFAAMNISAQDVKGKSVLIYTRNGEGYVHDNIEASVKALEEICEMLGVSTIHTDDPRIFQDKAFMDFDGIIFSNSNNAAFTEETQRSNFKAYIASGKGFMAVHSAIASERDWAWYGEMVGGKFIMHPKLQSFDIKIIDGDHLSTKHLPPVWKWEDECYFTDHLNPAIHVLLAVDLTTLNFPERDSYPGTVFGDLFPLAWCHTFEGTKVFYTALGHKIEYYDDLAFRKHLEGGIRYILGE